MKRLRNLTRNILLTASILSLFAFLSCQNYSETKTLELSPGTETSSTGSIKAKDAFLVKDADYIIHYKQKVLKDTDGDLYVSSGNDGFVKAESEDRSANPVRIKTKFTELTKSYDGFTYSYAVQKEKIVYIYYTRNTVTHSFYSKDGSTLVNKIQGTYGLDCPAPSLNLDTHLVVSSWNTSLDGSGKDFDNQFSYTDTSFYPKGTKTIIGTKLRPDTEGDIVFTDGSAATIKEVKESQGALLENYKKNTIALILFEQYNKYAGGKTDGNTVIGVGLQALRNLPYTEGETACLRDEFCTHFRGEGDEELQEDEYTSYMYFSSNFGKYDLEYLQDPKLGFGFNKQWTAFSIATRYPALCKAKLNMEISSSELLNDWYLPSWRELSLAVSRTSYSSLLKTACEMLGFSFPADPLNFWASPSTSQEATDGGFQGETLYYAAYVTFEKDYKELTMTPPQDGYDDWIEKNDQWNGIGKRHYGVTGHFTPNKMQVLPFREFK